MRISSFSEWSRFYLSLNTENVVLPERSAPDAEWAFALFSSFFENESSLSRLFQIIENSPGVAAAFDVFLRRAAVERSPFSSWSRLIDKSPALLERLVEGPLLSGDCSLLALHAGPVENLILDRPHLLEAFPSVVEKSPDSFSRSVMLWMASARGGTLLLLPSYVRVCGRASADSFSFCFKRMPVEDVYSLALSILSRKEDAPFSAETVFSEFLVHGLAEEACQLIQASGLESCDFRLTYSKGRLPGFPPAPVFPPRPPFVLSLVEGALFLRSPELLEISLARGGVFPGALEFARLVRDDAPSWLGNMKKRTYESESSIFRFYCDMEERLSI